MEEDSQADPFVEPPLRPYVPYPRPLALATTAAVAVAAEGEAESGMGGAGGSAGGGAGSASQTTLPNDGGAAAATAAAAPTGADEPLDAVLEWLLTPAETARPTILVVSNGAAAYEAARVAVVARAGRDIAAHDTVVTLFMDTNSTLTARAPCRIRQPMASNPAAAAGAGDAAVGDAGADAAVGTDTEVDADTGAETDTDAGAGAYARVPRDALRGTQWGTRRVIDARVAFTSGVHLAPARAATALPLPPPCWPSLDAMAAAAPHDAEWLERHVRPLYNERILSLSDAHATVWRTLGLWSGRPKLLVLVHAPCAAPVGVWFAQLLMAVASLDCDVRCHGSCTTVAARA